MPNNKYSLSEAEQNQIIRDTLNQRTWRSITPLTISLSILYFLFTIGHLSVLPIDIKTFMATISFTSAIIFALVATYKRFSQFSLKNLSLLTLIIFSTVLANTLIHLQVTQDMLHTTNLLLVLFGLCFFVLSTRWFLAMQIITIVCWAFIVSEFASDADFLHFIFSIASASVISTLFHRLRIRNHKQRERLRILNELQHKELEYQATHDPLTSLANRRLFFSNLDNILPTQQAPDKIALFYFDLNEFKQLNDQYGHEFGDEILKHTASKLLSVFNAHDTVARIGGDEFSTIMLNVRDKAHIQVMCSKIKEAFAIPVLIREQDVQIKTSIGFAIFPDDGVEADQLLEHADNMMYRDKNQRKQQDKFRAEKR